MAENCDLSDVARVLHGQINTKQNPWWKNEGTDWNDIYHGEKGAAMALAQKLAGKMELPPTLNGTADVNNPVWNKLFSKAPEKTKRLLFDFLSPKDSVASPILAEIKGLRDQVKEYIGDPANQDGWKVYKEQISTRAAEIKQEIATNPEKYGVDENNTYPTEQFLDLVENGWPYFEFQSIPKHLEADKGFKDITGNLMASHVTLNPHIYLFHASELPLRVFAQYPKEGIEILGDLLEDPHVLLGKPLPGAVREGVYSKLLPEEMSTWSKNDWASAMTGIPQCQTVAESMSYLLSTKGVNLEEALQNVAFSKVDPFDRAFMLTRPDSSNALGYIRYSMLQSAWYLNLVKRAVGMEGLDKAGKAMGALLMFSGMKAVLFGSRSAVPGGEVASKLIPSLDKESKKLDEEGGLNFVYQATGLDLGKHMSPVSLWATPQYPYKMLADTLQNGGRDYTKIQKALSHERYGAAGSTTLHLILLGLMGTGVKIPGTQIPVPYSVIKAVGAYGKTVNDAAGDPLNVDSKKFMENMVETNFGPEGKKRFKEHD